MFECSMLYVLVLYVLIIYVLYFHRSCSSSTSSSSSVLFVCLFICLFFICIFVHNNKPKNTNSVVKYKHKLFAKVYWNTTLSLVKNLSKAKKQDMYIGLRPLWLSNFYFLISYLKSSHLNWAFGIKLWLLWKVWIRLFVFLT